MALAQPLPSSMIKNGRDKEKKHMQISFDVEARS
jgi:hypothetical protein